MKVGAPVGDFTPPPRPDGLRLEGPRVTLEPLNAARHGDDLFAANAEDTEGAIWTYMGYGPFADIGAYRAWIDSVADAPDPVFLAIVRNRDRKALGVASYMRIRPEEGVIEVGNINYAPALQRTTEATEAMYLMMRWAFEQGYRRYEWKCHSFNARSRRAAQRLGFSYEGVSRQLTITKGCNRDTAWFAIIDSEWPALEACFQRFLSDDNFDEAGAPRESLSAMTRPLLYKRDDLELS